MLGDGLAVLKIRQAALLHLIDGAAVVLTERLSDEGGLLGVLGVVTELADQQRHRRFQGRRHLTGVDAELLTGLGSLLFSEAEHLQDIHLCSRDRSRLCMGLPPMKAGLSRGLRRGGR